MRIIDLLNKIPADLGVSLIAVFWIFAFIKFYKFLNDCEKEGKK